MIAIKYIQKPMNNTPILTYEKQVNIIKGTLDYCASRNLIDDVKFIIDNTIGIIKGEYELGRIDIIAK